MFKRYGLDVFTIDDKRLLVYSSAFSSINLLVKFACGFNTEDLDLDAYDLVHERSIPIYELIREFKQDTYGL